MVPTTDIDQNEFGTASAGHTKPLTKTTVAALCLWEASSSSIHKQGHRTARKALIRLETCYDYLVREFPRPQVNQDHAAL